MKLDMNWCLLHLSCHRNSAQYRFSPMSFHLISQYSMTYSLQGPISFSFTSIVSVPLWCMYHSVLELIAIAHLLSWSQCFAGLVMLYFSLTARYKMLRAYSAFFIKSVIRLLWYVITNYILEAYISNAFDVLFFIYIRNVIWSYCVVDLFSYCVTVGGLSIPCLDTWYSFPNICLAGITSAWPKSSTSTHLFLTQNTNWFPLLLPFNWLVSLAWLFVLEMLIKSEVSILVRWYLQMIVIEFLMVTITHHHFMCCVGLSCWFGAFGEVNLGSQRPWRRISRCRWECTDASPRTCDLLARPWASDSRRCERSYLFDVLIWTEIDRVDYLGLWFSFQVSRFVDLRHIMSSHWSKCSF
jgi:hypothetical protein